MKLKTILLLFPLLTSVPAAAAGQWLLMADLIGVEGDPGLDISALREVRRVIKSGISYRTE